MPSSYLTEKERMALFTQCNEILVGEYGSADKVLDVILPLSNKVLDVVTGKNIPIAYAAVRLACECIEAHIKEGGLQRPKKRAK